jgi:hypothetical protein
MWLLDKERERGREREEEREREREREKERERERERETKNARKQQSDRGESWADNKGQAVDCVWWMCSTVKLLS